MCKVRRRGQALTLLALLLASALASPNHDEIQANTKLHRAWQHYTPVGQRRLDDVGSDTCETIHTTKSFGPMRITWEIVDTSLPTATQDLVKDLMKRASAFWMKALQVRQASAPLRANRFCAGSSKFTFETEWMCVKALTDPVCGTDGAAIPAKYLNKATTCSEDRCAVNAGDCSACSHKTFTGVEGGQGVCDTCTEEVEGGGVMNSDFHAFVTVKDTDGCSGDTQAYAGHCVLDQCDRPTFGSVNFCLSKLSQKAEDLNTQVATAVHELAHALAFSEGLFKYFRNTDGTPKMPREADNAAKVTGEIKWTCSTSSYSFPAANGNRIHADLATANIVNVFNERDMNTCPCPIGKNTMGTGCIVPESGLRTPECVYKMITPKVVEKVREHFGCSTLNGAELENQATAPCSIVGSHWEQRIFMSEVMAPVHSASVKPLFVSEVTLALFEDSGWYKPVYTEADTLVKGVHWGYKQGCDFALNKCVSDGTTSYPRHWCTNFAQGHSACNLVRDGQVSCSFDGWASALPSQLTYFTSQVATGKLAEADYCPFYNTALSNRICTDSSGTSTPRYGADANSNLMYEVVGSSNSRCLESSFRGKIQVGNQIASAPASDFANGAVPACYEVVCDAQKTSYAVHMSDLAGGSVLLGTCTAAGALLDKMDFEGSVVCAAPSEMCGVSPSKLTDTLSGGPTQVVTTTAAVTTKSATVVTTTASGDGAATVVTTTAAATGGTTTADTKATTTVAGAGGSTVVTTTAAGTAGTTGSTKGGSTIGGGTGGTTAKAGTDVTTKAVTVVTTTKAAAKDLIITGGFKVNVDDADAFMEDTVAVTAVTEGIAKAIGADSSYVKITLNKIGRRLDSKEMEMRRLAGSAVQVDYVVTIPASASATQKAISDRASALTTDTLTTEVQAKVTAAKGADYKVTVTEITSTVIDKTVTGTSSGDVTSHAIAVTSRTGALLACPFLLCFQWLSATL